MLRKEVSLEPAALLLGVASVVLMGYPVYTQFNALGMAREEKNQEKTAWPGQRLVQQLQCLQEQGQELQHNWRRRNACCHLKTRKTYLSVN